MLYKRKSTNQHVKRRLTSPVTREKAGEIDTLKYPWCLHWPLRKGVCQCLSNVNGIPRDPGFHFQPSIPLKYSKSFTYKDAHVWHLLCKTLQPSLSMTDSKAPTLVRSALVRSARTTCRNIQIINIYLAKDWCARPRTSTLLLTIQ